MDFDINNVIFELRFLRNVLLAPSTKNNKIDYDCEDVYLLGMDIYLFRNTIGRIETTNKEDFVRCCNTRMKFLLFNSGSLDRIPDDLYNITDSQMSAILDMLTFFLAACNPREEEAKLYISTEYLLLFLILLVPLLNSNKRADCQTWMRHHLKTLIALRTVEGDNSLLHVATTMYRYVSIIIVVRCI